MNPEKRGGESNRRWPHLTLLCAALCSGSRVVAGNTPVNLEEKPFVGLSDQRVSDVGRAALAIDTDSWKHGETQHFVIHFQRSGQRIAGRCEDFYAETREFFGNRSDLKAAYKSHVFAFSDPTAWAAFKRAVELNPLFSGVTADNEFFWKATDDRGQFEDLAPVQRHEMTHLVFNRFFEGRPPLWLNEGVAEYFGHRHEFTSTAFRRRLKEAPGLALEDLFAATKLPRSDDDVHAFYAESSRIVFFLARTPERQALLPKFVDAMISGQDVGEAVKLYGYADLTDFARAYHKFVETL